MGAAVQARSRAPVASGGTSRARASALARGLPEHEQPDEGPPAVSALTTVPPPGPMATARPEIPPPRCRWRGPCFAGERFTVHSRSDRFPWNEVRSIGSAVVTTRMSSPVMKTPTDAKTSVQVDRTCPGLVGRCDAHDCGPTGSGLSGHRLQRAPSASPGQPRAMAVASSRCVRDALHIPDTDQRLIFYSAAPGTPDAAALALLRVVGLQHVEAT